MTGKPEETQTLQEPTRVPTEETQSLREPTRVPTEETQSLREPTQVSTEETQTLQEPTQVSTEETQTLQEPTQVSSEVPENSSSPPPTEEETKKWGTHIMGAPAVPTAHPDNKIAASWKAGDHQQISQQPYVVHSPIDKPNYNPLVPVIDMFNTWTKKAETVARNIWHNLKTGHSVSEVAWGKVNLTAKAMTEGGFESLFKQTFQTEPNEKLKKTFACYLSTATGPVAGTLYLSTAHVAFCSDRPLSFTAPSGQESWCYYKIMIPFGNISNVHPVTMKENPSEKYIQIATIDGHEFWFMGFVTFDKASDNLLKSVSDFKNIGTATV
ncbi:hypothetical protein Dsin_010771 [Dipteronia sinensis]|uniref:GRAM domain-containing protein n=1 Tax=Dipteronia sinensis TaxID=43782 RepID=A0AAE0ED01_9ROSI|nr:hypothetical protein Dsin_010771 [Dipteronia sinensis]